MPDKISAFVETVAGEIRWKRARPMLAGEIESHLLDQREDLISEGMDPEDAETEAVRQMGDPVKLGADLDRIHRPRPQWGLLAFALVLALAGMLLRYTLGADLILDSREKDVLALALGTGALLAGYFLDVSFLGRWAGIWVAGLAAVTAALCLFGWGSRGPAWLAQQLEVLFPAALALLLWSQRGKGWGGACISLAGFGAALAAAVLVPSTFTVLTLVLTGLALGLLFTHRDWFGVGRRTGMVLTGLVGLGVLGLLVWGMWGRLRYMFHPELDALGRGYFALAVRRALSGARWLGAAELKYPLYELVPNLESDALLVNLICSWGVLPFLLLVAAFLVFFLWAFYRAFKLRQTLGRAVSLAVLVTLLAQAVFSVLTNLGLPIFAAPFPLVMGNWNTVLDLFLIGLMLSAFRDGTMPETAAGKRPAPRTPRVFWRDGALTVSFRPRTGA